MSLCAAHLGCAVPHHAPSPSQLPAPSPRCPQSPSCTTDTVKHCGAAAPTALGSGTGEVFWQGRAPGGARVAAMGWDMGLGCGRVARGGIAPKDLPGPRPRGARCSGTAALANPTERQMAARMWDGRDGTGRAPPWPRTSRPTRWSRTPAPPGGHRECGTAGAGWWAMHTPAPGWSSAGAGR